MIAVPVLVSVNVPPAKVVVMSCPIEIPPDPTRVIVPEVVVSAPAVVNVPPLLLKLRAPVPVLIAPGNVSVVPATALKEVFACRVGEANEKSSRHTDRFSQ